MPTSLNASLNVSLNSASLNASSKQIKQALGRITGQASEFQKSLDASTARVFAFGATTAVLNGVTQSFKKLVATTVELQKRLVEINSIFQATESAFNRFRTAIFQVAKETGQSFGTVAEGAAELARQGLSAAETAERLKAALVLTRISGMDAEKSVKALTAAINGFTSAGLTANQIVNKMVAVDTAFAVSTQDLAEAFSRAGSTAEDAGVSFNELLGLITAVEQRTARGGAVIGNAFKSIFTRLSRGSTIDSLKELGVSIDATQSGIQKLQALSSALDKISDPTVASQIKELAGGVFQINVVSAALKDLGNDSSVFKNAALTAASATNEAFEKNVELNKTISAQMNSLVQGLTSLAERMGTLTFGPLLESLLGVAEKFTSFLDKALDPEKGNVFIKGFFKAIGSFLGGPAIILFTAAFAKIVKLVARFAVGGLKSLFEMGTQVERIKQIEGGIVGLLGRDAALRKTITSTTATQAQKEQAIITAIQTENSLLQQQAALVRGLANAAAARGVRGVGAAGFTGKGGRAFAGGFRAEEAQARILGAPAGVKAKRSSGTIGGQGFVMNNHETEIPRFGRNGDSAVIPHYAGGFVPNFAGPVGILRTQNLTNMTQFNARVKAQGHGLTTLKTAEGNVSPAQAKNAFATKGKKPANRLKLSGRNKAMLIPRLNFKDSLPARHQGYFKKGKHSFPYELTSALNIRGPRIPAKIDKAADPDDEKIRGRVADSVAQAGVNFARSIKPVTGRGVNKKKIMQQLLKQGGGKGALYAIIGAAFEAAVIAGLGIKARKKKGQKEGGDFDVRGTTHGTDLDRLNILFGLPLSTKLEDFKASRSASSVASFAKKMANEKYQNNSANMIKALDTGKAAGFIPNFAGGLAAAIEREEAAGIPVSKIRAHFGKGGRPKAVTNTKDEPRGLASLGFIPNFAKKGDSGGGGGNMGGLMMGLFALQGVLATFAAKQEQNISVIEEEIDKRNANIDVVKMGFKNSSAALSSNKKELAQRTKNTSSLTKFMEATNTAASALMALATINMLTGGVGGKAVGAAMGFGKKGKAAWGAAKINSGVSQARGMGKWAARSKAFGLGKKKGGVLGKAAGKLGAVGALGVGAYSAWKTSQDDSLSKDQRNERMGKTGVKAGMTAAGAALGTLIPIPVLGTLIGGIAGAAIGDWMTKGESKADKKREEGRTTAEKISDTTGSLGFKEERFNELASANIKKIDEEGGDAAAVQQRYLDAKEALTKLEEKSIAGVEVSNEELLAAEKELVNSSMRLVGSRFKAAENFESNLKDQQSADNDLKQATYDLAQLKKKQMKEVVDVVKEAKKREGKAELQAGLAGAIRGKFAGAVGLASEQNLMLKTIGTASAEKSRADRELEAGKGELPKGSDKLIGLQNAARKAGEAFRDQANKAGLSFANRIKKTEDLLEQNRKKQSALEKTRRKTVADAIENVISGKKSGDFGPLLDTIGAFKRYMIGADKEVRRKGRKSGDYDPDQLDEISGFEIEMKRQWAVIGESLGTFPDFLADVEKGVSNLLDKTQRERREETITGEGGLSTERDKDGFTAIERAQQRGGEGRGDAASKLADAENNLRKEIIVTEKNFKLLNEVTMGKDGKGGVKDKLDKLQTAMQGAAQSFEGVKSFVTTMSKSTEDTSKLVEKNNAFLTNTAKLISDQTKKIAGLQEEFDRLTRETD